jgi:DNA mismatch repair protein MutS2
MDDGQAIIDLRGKRVDDALDVVAKTLDKAAVREIDRVKVIHGHGTSDALKRAVRSYLSRSPYVKKWNAGSKDSGGDGVTWVELL